MFLIIAGMARHFAYLKKWKMLLRTICVILFFKKTNFLQDFHICISASFKKFVLFTNQKQPMKCVRQNNYLDMVSYTWYIIWQGVHFLVKLQAEGTNK